MSTAPSVFISYSHDSAAHVARVLALADRLRDEGIEVRLDQYVEHPAEGWPKWTQRQIVDSSFVLLVCTPTFRRRFDGEEAEGVGHGVSWEARIAEQLLYDGGATTDQLIPILFEEGTIEDVPLALRAFARYQLADGYEDLYRRLTNQPKTPPKPVGEIRVVPPQERPRFNAELDGSSGAAKQELDPTELVDELARVVWDPEQATVLAMRVGLARGSMPLFKTSAGFWALVMIAVQDGALTGGVAAVADAAAEQYPANAVFRKYRSR